MVLTDVQRDELRARFESDQSDTWASVSIGNQDIRAAVNALDDWFNAEASTINDALPEPAKSGLTTSQKSWLVTNLVDVRYGDA